MACLRDTNCRSNEPVQIGFAALASMRTSRRNGLFNARQMGAPASGGAVCSPRAASTRTSLLARVGATAASSSEGAPPMECPRRSLAADAAHPLPRAGAKLARLGRNRVRRSSPSIGGRSTAMVRYQARLSAGMVPNHVPLHAPVPPTSRTGLPVAEPASPQKPVPKCAASSRRHVRSRRSRRNRKPTRHSIGSRGLPERDARVRVASRSAAGKVGVFLPVLARLPARRR